MASWSGERIGRLSLRLDAVYCAVLGIGVVAAAPLAADALAVPVWAPIVVGTLVAGWAGLVWGMLAQLSLRTALRVVLGANVAAAAAVATISSNGTSIFVTVAMLAIAVDVGLFAASQAVALRRLQVVRVS